MPKLKVHFITKQIPVTTDRLYQFHTETSHDEELSLLKHIVQCRWPQHICKVLKEIQPYWTFIEELTIEDGLLLKGTQHMSGDDLIPTHWTPQVRQMSQQSQTVNVLAWTV